MSFERLSSGAAILLVLGCAADGPAPQVNRVASAEAGRADEPALTMASAFVDSFYAAYLPRSRASGLAATDSVIVEQPTAFSPTLREQLLIDSRVRAGAIGEIAGLDFDPFLASQDPCERYHSGDPEPFVVGAASSRVRVPLFAVCGSAPDSLPTLVVELELADGGWRFSNFHYGPPAGDLRALVRRLHGASSR